MWHSSDQTGHDEWKDYNLQHIHEKFPGETDQHGCCSLRFWILDILHSRVDNRPNQKAYCSSDAQQNDEQISPDHPTKWLATAAAAVSWPSESRCHFFTLFWRFAVWMRRVPREWAEVIMQELINFTLHLHDKKINIQTQIKV